MSRPAVRVGDASTCSLHGPGVVMPPCATNVVVGSMPAARMGDQVMCPPTPITPSPTPEPITGGTVHTLIENQGATRLGEDAATQGRILAGFPQVLIGKVMFTRVVIVAGTFWDNPAGRAEIQRQIEESERVQGIRIITGPHETVTDPTLVNIPDGPWNSTNSYSPQIVSAINRYGAPGRPAMIFTNPIVPSPPNPQPDAITVSTAWAQPADGLRNEGVIYGPASASDPLVVAHENGHLLSRQTGNNTHQTTNQNNVMWPFTGQRGDQWTDPWASSTEQNPVLR